MATTLEHMESCRKKFGKPFEEVHRYLDQWHGMFGGRHRFMLHHKEGVEDVRKTWGDEAAAAAEDHIMLDCNGIPNKEDYISKKVDWLGCGDDPYTIIDKRNRS